MVMGLLRAVPTRWSSRGTLAVDRNHLWTAEDIFPGFGVICGLRAALGKRGRR